MFSKKYTILLITAIGFTACSTKPQTITISPNSRTKRPPIRATTPIKEEILIRNNPNLGTRVTVPKNRPTLGIKSTDGNGVRAGSELNGEMMERMAFPEDEYRVLKKIGRSTVSGRVYLHNATNDKQITKGRVKLLLNPVTSYSRQWYEQSYLSGYKLSPVDKRINNYLRVEYSIDDGTFRFFGVPRGSYYLIGQISCGAECGYPSTKHLRLVKEITVGSDLSGIELMKNVP
jgi:hypothetical protein